MWSADRPGARGQSAARDGDGPSNGAASQLAASALAAYSTNMDAAANAAAFNSVFQNSSDCNDANGYRSHTSDSGHHGNQEFEQTRGQVYDAMQVDTDDEEGSDEEPVEVHQVHATENSQMHDDDDSDSDSDDEVHVVAVREIDSDENDSKQEHQLSHDEDELPVVVATVEEPLRGKPMALAMAAKEAAEKEAESHKETKTPKKKKRPPAKRTPSKKSPKEKENKMVPVLDDQVPDIAPEEYENVEELMTQFCKVPLLAEFSRSVAQLHPELNAQFSKIVKHPMDLGRVCRAIRRRQYRNTRAIRIDMWRIFANCVKYHSHPSNKKKMASFISIALHLREHFNNLWEEYMLPSEYTATSTAAGASAKKDHLLLVAAHEARAAARQKRLEAVGTTILSVRCIERAAGAIKTFIELGGRVDVLDEEGVLEDDDDDDEDLDLCVENLSGLKSKLLVIATSMQEYTVDDLHTDLCQCYTADDIFETRPAFRKRFASRLGRLLGKIVVPIFESSCRGVNQSSIWGCMAAAIWARESSKKPYWPALVLGILAPEDQAEEWHNALTKRNEGRLPDKLRNELQVGKRKAEQAIRRQSQTGGDQMSFFLAEFMGTHEFIWVKEADIIENFDPEVDPNQTNVGNVSKKKRSSRTGLTTPASVQMLRTAVEEGKWALEEFEMQLNDNCGDMSDEEDVDGDELNYSYGILCQSDDEEDDVPDEEVGGDDKELTLSDIEEQNELLASQGIIDLSTAGRKTKQKKSISLKKQKALAEKKEKAAHAKKAAAKARAELKEKRERDREAKREREAELKRKKKRERERTLEEQRKRKKANEGKGKIRDKRERAAALARGYVMRITQKEDLKGLGLGGVMTLPVSSVESTGLLGMALAFRAAGGALHMQGEETTNPLDDDELENVPKTSDRCKLIEKKMALLEKKIEEMKQMKEKRDQLRQKAIKNAKHFAKELIHKEDLARKKGKLIKTRKKVDRTDKKKTTAEKKTTHGGGANKTKGGGDKEGAKGEQQGEQIQLETEETLESPSSSNRVTGESVLERLGEVTPPPKTKKEAENGGEDENENVETAAVITHQHEETDEGEETADEMEADEDDKTAEEPPAAKAEKENQFEDADEHWNL